MIKNNFNKYEQCVIIVQIRNKSAIKPLMLLKFYYKKI